ncbi:MAG: LysE family translocator [Alphaproteobacteria bacterium]|nr:LysE family translocator [Alphaproteobacteria bacterium]
MSTAGLLTFATVYFVALVMPGPGVTAVIARVLARGTKGAPALILGETAGSVVWFIVAVAGLAVLTSEFATFFIAIRYAAAAYLLYLAWKFWTAPITAVDIDEDVTPDGNGRLFLAGLAINLGNPKNVVFFLALLPTVVDLDGLTLLGFTELVALIVAIVVGVLAAYTLAADRARRMFTSPRAIGWMNRGGAAIMAGTAAAIAAR